MADAASRPVVIDDAGPLIALSRIGAIDLLRGVFGRVQVSAAVCDEILPGPDFPGKPSIVAAFDAGWLQLIDADMHGWQPLNPGVDLGEASAIVAASGHADALLIMDDRAGRAEARSRGIAVVGTAAVIGMACLNGQIPQARPVLEDLVQAGYFISQPIIEAVLADIGETTDIKPREARDADQQA